MRIFKKDSFLCDLIFKIGNTSPRYKTQNLQMFGVNSCLAVRPPAFSQTPHLTPQKQVLAASCVSSGIPSLCASSPVFSVSEAWRFLHTVHVVALLSYGAVNYYLFNDV